MERIYVIDLAIEVTRRCNFRCKHCMRGENENKDIDTIYIKELLKQIHFIGSLLFTGGEPSLNTHAMRETLKYCKEFKIPVLNICIVTNGKEVSDDFIKIAKDWYYYCNSFVRQPCNYGGTQISQDIYHEKISQKNIDKILAIENGGIKTNDYSKHLLNLGRAKNLQNIKKDSAGNLYTFSVSKYKNNYYIHKAKNLNDDSAVYLTCNGNIIPATSYEYNTEKMFTLCDYKTFTDYIKTNYKNIEKFNFREEANIDKWIYK